MSLSEATGLGGLIFGLAGFVLGVLNYLRDRHRVNVSLQWDLDVTENSGYDATKKWGLITVTNVGRRATYVSHVALRLPKGHDATHLLIRTGIEGKKLTEGDPAAVYVVDQAGMEAYREKWRDVIAQVSDSSSKVWTSQKLKRNEIPSWAK